MSSYTYQNFKSPFPSEMLCSKSLPAKVCKNCVNKEVSDIQKKSEGERFSRETLPYDSSRKKKQRRLSDKEFETLLSRALSRNEK